MIRRTSEELRVAIIEWKPCVVALLSERGQMRPINIRQELGIDESLLTVISRELIGEGLLDSTGKFYKLKLADQLQQRETNIVPFVAGKPAEVPALVDLVQIKEGELYTTSLIVAEVFGKEHRHVLRAIDDLECSEEFRVANFGQSNYLNLQGKDTRLVEITRDGFMFLAMGFTGKEAAALKERFIAEFNRRGEELQRYRDSSNSVQINGAIINSAFERLGKTLGDLNSGQKEILDVQKDFNCRLTLVENTLSKSIKLRKYFPRQVIAAWHYIDKKYFDFLCPVCMKANIANDAGFISKNCELAHLNDVHMNGLKDGIPLCPDCHKEHQDSNNGGKIKQASRIENWHLIIDRETPEQKAITFAEQMTS